MSRLTKRLRYHKYMYLLMAPALLVIFYFCYLPMAGIVMAFMDYNIVLSFAGSTWAGLNNFTKVLQLPEFLPAVFNTLKVSSLSIILSTFFAVTFALLLNEVRNKFLKRFTQTVSYLPYFISWISVVGMAFVLYAIYGSLNDLRVFLLGPHTERLLFRSFQWFFLPNILILTLWRNTGFNSILYLAAITAIDPQLYEAAHMDGAGRWQQMRYITLPGMLNTIIIILILNIGTLVFDNFELIYGMQNAYINFDVIQTLVFKYGIQGGNYSVSAALSLMQGLVSMILVVTANRISNRLSKISLF